MIALLLVAFFQSAAPASEAAAPAATPPAKAAKPACRKETVVGSTIKKRICPRKVEEVAQEETTDQPQMAQAK